MADSELDIQYRELVDAAPDGVVVVDQDGTIVLFNVQAEKMFGYPRAEILGKQVEVLIPHRFAKKHPQHVASYQREPHTRPMGSGLELFGRRRDGSEFPVEISLSPIRTSKTLVSAAIRDVSDRKRIEAEARRANAFLLSAVDSIQDAFVLYDEEDRIVLVNSTFRELLGPSLQGPVVGRRFSELVDRSLADQVFELGDETPDAFRKRWVAYHEVPQGAFEVRTRSGRVLKIVDRPTAEHGTVSLMIDMTEDRLRGDELRRAHQAAEAASAAKSEFLASMSHELRTPLNAVLGFAQLLQRDKKQPLTERQLERIDHVLRGGEHLLKLIDEVLDLSRIEAGGVTISAEPVTLPEVLQEVMTTLEPMAQRANVSVATSVLPANLPPVIADRTRLAQILMNFGSNAIKYNKSGGHVRFEVSRHGEAVRITVVDDGIGIPEDKRAKIFEPFHRAGQETGPIQGTGIGLAISKRLAELMKGNVGFTSETNRGSQFWVEVPIDHVGGDVAVPNVTAASTSPLVQSTPRHRIVYIEDNPSNIAFMRELMEDLPGIELITAPTAELGIELVRAHRPEVVIMDINLPGMSGIDATKLLASYPETKDIPVIALTAAALGRDLSRGQDVGFYRYLTKPVKVGELTAVLEEILAKR